MRGWRWRSQMRGSKTLRSMRRRIPCSSLTARASPGTLRFIQCRTYRACPSRRARSTSSPRGSEACGRSWTRTTTAASSGSGSTAAVSSSSARAAASSSTSPRSSIQRCRTTSRPRPTTTQTLRPVSPPAPLPRHRRRRASAGASLPSFLGLDLEDDREDHRAAAGAFADERADGVVDVFLEELQLGDVLRQAIGERPLSLVARLTEERPRLGEAARDDLRRCDLAPVLRPERDDHDQDAVLRKVAAVSQSDVLYVPHSQAVDERLAGLDRIDDSRTAVREFDDGAVLSQDDVLAVHPGVAREPAVSGQHAELSVDGHHVARAQDGEDGPELLGVTVTGDVHRRDLLMEDLCSRTREAVDRVVDPQLVTRHGLGRDDDRVAFLYLDEGVIVISHASQSRHRLALASGAEDHRLVGSQLGQQVRLDKDVLRHVQVPQVARDVDVFPEGAADQTNLSLVLERDVDRLLHPVNVRGERGAEDAPLALGDDLAEDLAHGLLRQRDAWALGVRGIAEQDVHAAVAKIGELAKVRTEAVHGRVVDLVVAGVDDPSAGRLEHYSDGIGNRVRHAHELGAVRADLNGFALRLDFEELGAFQEPVLVELRLDEAQRQTGRPDLRNAHLAQEKRKRSGVILVPMCDDEGADVVFVVAQVAEVRQHEVDAEVLVTREGKAGVDHDDALVGFHDHHVLPDLAQAAERDQSRGTGHSRKCMVARWRPRPESALRCSMRSAARPSSA